MSIKNQKRKFQPRHLRLKSQPVWMKRRNREKNFGGGPWINKNVKTLLHDTKRKKCVFVCNFVKTFCFILLLSRILWISLWLIVCIFLYFVATCSVCTEFQKDKNEKIEEIRPDMTIWEREEDNFIKCNKSTLFQV